MNDKLDEAVEEFKGKKKKKGKVFSDIDIKDSPFEEKITLDKPLEKVYNEKILPKVYVGVSNTHLPNLIVNINISRNTIDARELIRSKKVMVDGEVVTDYNFTDNTKSFTLEINGIKFDVVNTNDVKVKMK